MSVNFHSNIMSLRPPIQKSFLSKKNFRSQKSKDEKISEVFFKGQTINKRVGAQKKRKFSNLNINQGTEDATQLVSSTKSQKVGRKKRKIYPSSESATQNKMIKSNSTLKGRVSLIHEDENRLLFQVSFFFKNEFLVDKVIIIDKNSLNNNSNALLNTNNQQIVQDIKNAYHYANRDLTARIIHWFRRGDEGLINLELVCVLPLFCNFSKSFPLQRNLKIREELIKTDEFLKSYLPAMRSLTIFA